MGERGETVSAFFCTYLLVESTSEMLVRTVSGFEAQLGEGAELLG